MFLLPFFSAVAAVVSGWSWMGGRVHCILIYATAYTVAQANASTRLIHEDDGLEGGEILRHLLTL